jgi:hypothetical protein
VPYVPGRGFDRHQWDIPGHYWNFVRGRDFMDRRIDRWIVPAERNMTLVRRTELKVSVSERDRRVVNDGLDLDVVQRQTSRTIERATLKDATRPGPAREEGRDLVISRPVIRHNEAARPRQALDEQRAEREINSERSSRIYRRPARDEEEVVREEHDLERQLMRESQETEIGVVRRRAEEEKAKVQDQVGKKKVEDQAEARVSELKKSHEQEKIELEKRQKSEEEKARKAPAKKAPVRKKDERSPAVVD